MESILRSSVFATVALLVLGCGAKPSTPAPSPPTSANPRATEAVVAAGEVQPASPSAEKTSGPAKTVALSTSSLAAEADEPSPRPATVEAARVLDLATLPLMPGAKDPGTRVVASLSYQAPGTVKEAYEFQRRTLLERQWKELSDPQIYDQSASGQFGHNGFHLSVSVSPAGEAGSVAIRLQNHGNVNLRKLPVPSGAKFQYAFPGIASFITEAGVEETTQAVRKLLVEQGWQPYGTAGDSMHLKQNAVLLNARVLAPPAQPGKTVIDYSTTQMSADLPAPADAESVQYADSNKRLDVDAPGTPDDIAQHYKAALAAAGWQATTENPVKDGFTSFMIFRNPQKDLLQLDLRDLKEEKKTRFSLKHQSAAEVEELERRAKLAIEERKKKEEELRNRPKPKAALSLPAGAQDVQADKSEIEFKLPTGKAKPALDAISKQLASAGFKAEERVGNDMAGQLSFTKGEQRITVQYIDPGFIPAEITISASGVELERGTTEKE
jgi:hypothetical protein